MSNKRIYELSATECNNQLWLAADKDDFDETKKIQIENIIKYTKETIYAELFPVGSFYFSTDDTCPLKTIIQGSIWQKMGDKLITGGSIAYVKGNGNALGLESNIQTTQIGYPCISNSGNHTALYDNNNSIPKMGEPKTGNNVLRMQKYIGVTTQAEKSGLVVDTNDMTGVTVNIFRRIK